MKKDKPVSIIYKHWLCVAHRLVGHKGACARIHGHNYLIEIEIEAPEMQELGMIMDFSDAKKLFGGWLDENWDHRMLVFRQDPIIQTSAMDVLKQNGAIVIPFNPTAENMANFLRLAFEALLVRDGLPQKVASVTVHETHKGSATSRREHVDAPN